MPFHSPVDLRDHGIEMPAPESVFVDSALSLANISRDGVVLHPGVRVEGKDCVLGPGVELGSHGPVVLRNSALGRGASIASGTAESCTLLPRAALGPDAWIRVGTLLEEEASTGHGVGLKQTILLSFGTLGSQINFCDALLAGGRSRRDHSEVGSGFIHFNFTPFGARGDKATASLFGEVVRGVLLDQDRIFLGGAGGVVGPVEVGFGTVLAAGSVYRRDYPPGVLVYGESLPARVIPIKPLLVRGIDHKVARSLRYLGQLHALSAWYREVRIVRALDELERLVLVSAQARISEGIAERVRQIDRLLEGAEEGATGLEPEAAASQRLRVAKVAEPWRAIRDGVCDGAALRPDDGALEDVKTSLHGEEDHVAWVRSLDPRAREAVTRWLGSIAASFEAAMAKVEEPRDD